MSKRWPVEGPSRVGIVFRALVALAGASWTSACGDGATEPPRPDPPRATTVTVTPATAQLSALGATVQLSAQVLDQNGQAMAGAAVAWSSGSATIAMVDDAGLVTAVGNGTAMITAASGSANRSAAVTVAQVASAVTVAPATDTLLAGDTLRFAARAEDAHGYAIAGAMFSWTSSDAAVAAVDSEGLVTAVAAGEAEIAATSGGAVGRAALVVDRAPLVITGTAYVDPDILTSSDPSTFREAAYAGRGSRLMFDRRHGWVTHDAFLFDATYTDGFRVEIQVNPEFETREVAQAQADRFGWLIGQLPIVLRSSDFRTVWIHKGRHPFGGRNNNVLIHTGEADSLAARGFLEEVLVHEATHTALDSIHAAAPGWIQAQRDDMDFISTYARDNPAREDLAESFSMWMALRFREDRIFGHLAATIRARMPHRLSYFDRQNFSMLPVR